MDGRELVRHLRDHAPKPQIAHHHCQLHCDGGDLNDLLRDRYTAFMGKPIDFLQLSAAVGRMTHRRTTEFVEMSDDEQKEMRMRTTVLPRIILVNTD